MRRIRSHLTFANIAAGLALVIALASGTAYAADTVFSTDIVDGEVKAPDIASNAVRTGKIGNNEVRSADVRDDTLLEGGLGSSDIAPGAITAADVAGESLTGDEVADESLTVSDITDESLTGDVVANDSLTGDDISNLSTITGSDINESTLSTVPNATNASDAQTVLRQSFQKIGFEASNGGGATGFSNIGDLNLEFRCDAATGDLTLRASTDLDDATLAVSDDDSYFDDENFDTTDGLVDILTPLGGDSDEVINLIYVNGAGFGIHDKVTAQFLVLDEAPPGTQSECIVDGHAIASNDT